MLMLKRLELNGFKSFAKKTVLDFNTPVTAIVGPNGSGKSNVVEAIRFVLGEQSIKSLRGKGGADMIFKGSKSLSSLSRASATIVFDNSQKVFSIERSGDKKLNLDFDEVAISREVFSDGSNTYKVNGIEVRLKDIVELVSSVHIGSSGHHIISQGEADRLLSANSKDRRGMIEDALGLKVYQYRLKEGERKLEKTLSNMKEIQALRREIGPHMSFLKKQVEKIEKALELRTELTQIYKEYFSKESSYITNEKNRLGTLVQKINISLTEVDKRISDHESGMGDVSVDTTYRNQISVLETELSKHTTSEAELTRKLGRVEGTIGLLEQQLQEPEKEIAPEHIMVPLLDIEGLFTEIGRDLESVMGESDVSKIRETIARVKETCSQFIYYRTTDTTHAHTGVDREAVEKQIQSLRESCQSVETEIAELEKNKFALRAQIDVLTLEERNSQGDVRAQERAYYELKAEKTELESQLRIIRVEEEQLVRLQNDFEQEMIQAGVLIGVEAARFPEFQGVVDRKEQDDLKRKLDRIKYKLEDAGAAGGSEVLKEYEETVNRDAFLSRELADIEQAVIELRDLIRELKEKIDTEFKIGVEKINTQFTDFFALMFGGGHAFLSIVVEHKRPARGEEGEDEIPLKEEGDFEFERGIEINVSLPHKKVRDLHMLSGGERSLTSIALLFAMSQVNPPPFLVLDETDAALDEANSRRYGDMIENLSKYSQLIVVTHNRETMSRASVLYGVTIGSDGASKLLSIKFDEAVQIAK